MGTEGERDLSRSAVTMRPNNALLANIDTVERPFSLGGGRIALRRDGTCRGTTVAPGRWADTEVHGSAERISAYERDHHRPRGLLMDRYDINRFNMYVRWNDGR